MFKKSILLVNFYSRRLLSLKQPSGLDWKNEEKILMEPFEHIQDATSKYHGLIAPAFNHWLDVPENIINDIQEAMQTFMTWTILLDDIQDMSAFRFGVPSAHEVFGVGLTINAANNAMLLGQKQVADLGHPLAPKLLSNVLHEYFLGQGIDIYWRDNFTCPTEEAHIDMTKKKCGSWFTLPVKLMQLFSKNKTEYGELANHIGAYYHLIDDYYNLFQPKDNHTTCSDITESKITLPIIHALQFPDVAVELTYILKQRTSDPKLLNQAMSLLKKHGSGLYVRDALSKMEAEIQKEIDQLGGNPVLTAFMNELTSQKRSPGRDL